MRIAVVCSDLGIRVPGDKGASIHLQSISKAFAAIGHDVLLVGVAGHGDPPDGLQTRLMTHPGRSAGLRREIRKLRFTERFERQNRGALNEFDPHLVYERLALFGTAGRRLAKACGATHVVEVNALLSVEEQQWRGLRLSRVATSRERSVLDHAALRVAVSDEVASQIDEASPGGRTVVVPNGVERGLFAELPSPSSARAAFGLPVDATIVGFTGALRPWHGIEVALEALTTLADRTILAVAGDGPLRPELEALARRLGVADRVRWFGRVPHDRIPTFLATVDVAIAPYPELASFAFSPLKLYEYLAAGVPVVASDVGQVRGVLADGALGALTTPGDPSELADAIRAVTTNPAPARARAAHARDVALEHHGWEQRAAEILRQTQDTEVALAR